MKRILIVMLTVFLSACTGIKQSFTETDDVISVFLTKDKISDMSSVFEKKISEAAEVLQMGTVVQDKTIGSEWDSDQEAVFDENRFKVILLSYKQNDDNLFYGLNYRCMLPDDGEEAKKIISEIYQKAVDQFGDPDTYPGFRAALQSEDILQSLSDKEMMTFYDEWNISENVVFIVQVETAVPVLNIIYKQI